MIKLWKQTEKCPFFSECPEGGAQPSLIGQWTRGGSEELLAVISSPGLLFNPRSTRLGFAWHPTRCDCVIVGQPFLPWRLDFLSCKKSTWNAGTGPCGPDVFETVILIIILLWWKQLRDFCMNVKFFLKMSLLLSSEKLALRGVILTVFPQGQCLQKPN